MRRQTAAGFLVLAALVCLAVLSAIPPARADLPEVTVNPDASRTVKWNLTTTEGLTLENVSLDGGHAVLRWENEQIDWQTGDEFLSHGSADPNITVDGSSLALLADNSNHIVDGAFSLNASWSYKDEPTGNVTARWDVSAQSALLEHESPAVSLSAWDRMDDINLTWDYRARSGVSGGVSQEYRSQLEGSGALNLSFSMGAGEGLYAGAGHIASLDWSAYDRLSVWVKAGNVSSALAFNVTAEIDGVPRTTKAQSLRLGWQEVVLNLDDLGTPLERSSLQNLILRIYAQDVPGTFVYFDDIRLANAKVFAGTAVVAQAVTKAVNTTRDAGSSTLEFDWNLDASGVRFVQAVLNVTGNATAAEFPFPNAPLVSWRASFVDLSSAMASAGTYTISFQLRVAVDNTSASAAHLRIDNVSLLIPNRRNGTYESDPIPLTAASEFVTASWAGSLPPNTTPYLRLRAGNNSNTTTAGWSNWQTWNVLGTHPVSLPGARYFQVRVELETRNASISPRVESFRLETQHRAARGTVSSGLYRAISTNFLRWRSFDMLSTNDTSTSISFLVGNGTYWTPVRSDGNVSGFSGLDIKWRAVLATVDGLATPALTQVQIVYEYLGDIERVVISPGGRVFVESGGSISFQATGVDAGGHIITVPIFDWRTNDPHGSVDNNGTYTAGDIPGNYVVTATEPVHEIVGTVEVTVTPAPLLRAPIDLLPYVLVALVAGGVSYGGYQVAIRRMFAIDDVFLISKEGRLLMHNTRRMRADRDEDILSAMFTAILAFLRDFDREENGDLRRLEFGGKTTLLERGDHAYLAAVYSGRVPRWAGKDLRRFMYDLELRFGEVFARWSGDPDDLQGLKEFSDRFVSRFRYRSVHGRKRWGPRTVIGHRGKRTR